MKAPYKLLTPAVFAICGGCASQMLSDDRLRAHTAPLVGVSANELTIVSRNEQGTNTYYTVKTGAGAEYQCSINGGGVLAAGMVQGGQCTKRPDATKSPTSSVLEPARSTGISSKPDPAKKSTKK